jgi:hypothetical protein
MRRRDFVVGLGSTTAWPFEARAQQPDRMRRVGVLMDTAESNSDGQARIAAFREVLQGLGWTEGRNIQIEYRWGVGDVERTHSYAAELVSFKPDVIFAYAAAQLAPLSRETKTIPIIFVGALLGVACVQRCTKIVERLYVDTSSAVAATKAGAQLPRLSEGSPPLWWPQEE